MRQLLHVVHFPTFGGPHNQALRLAGPLSRQGWQTTVVLPDDPGNAATRLREGGLDVVTMPLGRLRATRDIGTHAGYAAGFAPDVQRLRHLIRERRIDVVLIAGLVNSQAAIAARLEHTPLVWQLVDTRPPEVVRMTTMLMVRTLADSIMTNGKALKAWHERGRPLRQPSFPYYPPVDTDFFVPSAAVRAETRVSLGIPADATVIGMVANLNPQKGIEYFIRAAGLLEKTHPGAYYVAVGASYETHREYSRLLEHELQLSGVPRERFIFAGERGDVEKLYPAFDVKLITSVGRSEGTTTTAIEAMACGVPVVATDVGAVHEVVANGVTGFVVPPAQPGRIAAVVAKLLDSPDLRQQMGLAGRAMAVQQFGIDACVDAHLRAFDAAMQRAGVNHETQERLAA